MVSLLKPIGQNQAVITISDISGVYWSSSKGGKVTRQVTKYDDGQTGLVQSFLGFIELSEITLMKSFDPSADKAVLAWVDKQLKMPTPFNVAIQPIKADLAGSQFEGSSQILYSNCQLKDYDLPDFDRTATGVAMMEIVVIFNSLPSYS